LHLDSNRIRGITHSNCNTNGLADSDADGNTDRHADTPTGTVHPGLAGDQGCHHRERPESDEQCEGYSRDHG
jgi:hypothetical protein